MFKEFVYTINNKYKALLEKIESFFTQEEVEKIISATNMAIKEQKATISRESIFGTYTGYYQVFIINEDFKDGNFVVFYPNDEYTRNVLQDVSDVNNSNGQIRFQLKENLSKIDISKKLNLRYVIYNDTEQKLHCTVVLKGADSRWN